MKTYLVVGLGNPENRYAHTRHNIGFIVLDNLREYFQLPEWKEKKTLLTDLSEGEKISLAKPTTYMNESGRAVTKLKKHYPKAGLIVVHDDLDLAFGKIRVSRNSGHAGHRGVASIIESLGTKDFTRVRLGIGRPAEGVPADEYVLQSFTPSEQKIIPTIIEETVTTIIKILAS